MVAAVSARKQRMISFSSGAVMALLSKSLMYTEADDILAAAALAVKEQGVVPQQVAELCSPAPWRPAGAGNFIDRLRATHGAGGGACRGAASHHQSQRGGKAEH